MTFLNFLNKSTPKDIINLIELLKASKLVEHDPQIGILILKLIRYIDYKNELDLSKIDDIKELYLKINKNYQKVIINLVNIVQLKKEESLKKDSSFKIETKYINFDFSYLTKIDPKLLEYVNQKALEGYHLTIEKAGAGKEFLGWVDLPVKMNKEILDKIVNLTKRIRQSVEAIIFVGIGGSYLGAKAVIEALRENYYNLNYPQIYFLGQELCSSHFERVLDLTKNKKVAIIPISKSGTTLEPAIAFRILQKIYITSKNKPIIIAITDEKKGALRELANNNKWETFPIPDDIGGRYSVLSYVGLLPISLANIDIYELIEGALYMYNLIINNNNYKENPAISYAMTRQILNILNKDIEILVTWTQKLTFVAEWYKQLFGESEGKNLKGIFPTSCNFTTDLHSLGQLIQNSKRNIFETFLYIQKENENIKIPEEKDDIEKLNYLKDKTLDYINLKALQGTKEAHEFGDVPVNLIGLSQLSAKSLGALLYFFEFACSISAHITCVNPFDQPGVEEYKKRIKKLLEE